MHGQSQGSNLAGIEAQLEPVLHWLAGARATEHTDVAEKSRLLLLDTLGCAIAGLGRSEVAAYAKQLAGRDELACPGFPAGLAPAHFGQVMALAACWDEACEGLARAHGRPGLHAVPAAVALSLAGDGTLGATLDAFAAGYEIGGRVGEAWRIRAGMHVDGTWGTITAAIAASAIVDGLTVAAMGAAVQAAACSLPANLYAPVRQGATVRNLYAAQAVSRGIETALALKAGVSAPAHVLDETIALTFDPKHLSALAPPGEWFLLQGYFKPFAAVRHVHYGAHAALDWRAQHGAATAAITAINLRTYPEAVTYCGNRAPAQGIQAQFSLTYGLAHALVRGTLGPEAYDESALADAEIRRIEKLITVDEGGTFASGRGAHVIVIAGGVETTVAVDRVEGDPDRPMLAASVVAKFQRYAGPRIGDRAAADLADRIMVSPFDAPLVRVLDGN